MFNKKGQARMPSSFGGLVQYYSEYKSKITIKPEFVLIFGVVFVGAIIALSAFL
ncbi:MAG: preprotein translocase subunit Sec61beta [Candidatus Parvarchaeota archaeon]|jgi:preprotein translocase subunit Sec61beta|nr:preprotein translocase subunit Sec61beta [Candidatus Parvarchaeota archaeon]MCL5100995.1 preprotein translocase subunit Sec61beta [Candidatus Parvarchaeota archaeon]